MPQGPQGGRHGRRGRVGHRSRARRAAAACTLLVLGAAAVGGPISAAPPPAGGGLALVLCLDTSGSMRWNDPDGARAAAVRRIAAGMPAGDSLGLVGFSGIPRVLLPLRGMGNPAAVRAADAAAGGLGAAGATDILAALRTGAAVLATDPRTRDSHVLVLLTDGVPDLPALSSPAALAAYVARMDGVALGLARRGWVLDTVGLGSGVDAAELRTLARDGGGTYLAAGNAQALGGTLLGLLAHLRRRIVVQAPPRPPQTVVLRALPPPSTSGRRGPVSLRLRVRSALPGTVRLAIVARTLPPGWGVPGGVEVPPGQGTVSIPLRVPARASGPTTVTLGFRAPRGVALSGAALTWRLPAPPAAPVAWARHHAAPLLAAVAALLALPLGAGYLGYLLRVRPGRQLGGRLEVRGPHGESLGQVPLPRRGEVGVGAAGSSAAVRLPWVSGEDTLFRLHATIEAPGGRWRSGLAAWRRPPQGAVYAAAAWPYHLYPGPVPQRRVELYDGTTFGAGGLTFTLRFGPFEGARGVRGRRVEAPAAGVDLLAGLPEEARAPAAGRRGEGAGAPLPPGARGGAGEQGAGAPGGGAGEWPGAGPRRAADARGPEGLWRGGR